MDSSHVKLNAAQFKVIKLLKLVLLAGFAILSVTTKAVSPYKIQLADPVLEPWRWTDFPEYDTIRISCVAREPGKGLWLGIGNKAVYYDGYKTTSFVPDSSTVHSMFYEKSNSLLLTTSKGLFRYQNGESQKLLDFRFNSLRNFVADANGDSWIGSDLGILKITSTSIFCLNPEGFFEIDANGTVLKVLKTEKSGASSLKSVSKINFPAYNLAINRDQRVWMTLDMPDKNMGTIDLSKINSGALNWKFTKIPSLNANDISAIYEYKNSVWVTSGNPNIALLQYSIPDDKWKSVNLKMYGGDNVQTSITESSDGSLWIGGHSKLYRLTESGWRVYLYPEVLLPLSYLEIYVDSTDNMFLSGSNGSLVKIDLSTNTFGTLLGLNFCCNSADGKYWFTTNTGTIVSADPSMKYFQECTQSDGIMDMAMDLYYSKESGLWAAGSHRGIAAVARYQNGRWLLNTFPDLYLGIAYSGIIELGDSAIAFPGNGILELDNTNFKGGFVAYNYKQNEWQKFPSSLVPQRIPSIGITSNGNLWFSGNSLQMFDGHETRNVELPAKILSWTDDIGITPTDHIWVAQGGTGLFYNDGKKWTRFTTFNGLASNMVTNILAENDSSVYIASDKGISFFDGKQFIPQIIHPDLSIQRERGFLQKSVDGTLWINQATREWYLYDFKNIAEKPESFKTTFYRKELLPPKTTIQFSDHEISSSGNVIITYSAVDYWNQTPGNKIQYSYRLNKSEWSPFSTEKSSVFLDLNAGNYNLEVRARDLNNNIEPEAALISFTVLRPVYMRAWFILTILTFLGIIVWLLLRLYARNKQIHELDQLKLRLFTDISHELKTPLTLISLPLQKLIDKAKKRNEPESHLELIYNNVQRLNNLVNQVVDFRRMEAGKIQLELSPGDLILQLKNIYNYYLPLAHEKNLKFNFDCEIKELWAKYDADKLEKIVVNLLSNAFKYTPENEEVELQVKISPESNRLHLWVIDSGPGIPQNMQQNIFDRYYRLKNEKSNRIPGSGIGLSLVKELVTLHQGSIEVKSDGIHGTSFYVSLPLLPAEKTVEQNEQKAEIDLSKFAWDQKASVLLIEDEEQMLRFVSGELQNYFAVKGVSSVESAYELLENEMFDLIISDVMLPGMSGTDFCRKLKSDPLTSHLPVILLTARDSEEEIIEGLKTGADDYITKPFRMNELVARSFNQVENRRKMKERFADQEEIEVNTFVQNNQDRDYLEKAIKVVFENLDNPEFDVPHFCQEMNSSKTLLYSKLKALTGQSATEFVRNIRLKEAKKLLQHNARQHTISEISYMVGFNDPLYFSRCFRKYFGVPPSEIGK